MLTCSRAVATQGERVMTFQFWREGCELPDTLELLVVILNMPDKAFVEMAKADLRESTERQKAEWNNFAAFRNYVKKNKPTKFIVEVHFDG